MERSKRMILVFSPRTSPTYLPLGIACLSAVACGLQQKMDVFDGNLWLWNQLCDMDLQGFEARNFSHSSLSWFLSPENYTQEWSKLGGVRQKISLLEEAARRYLEGNGLTPELERMLTAQTHRIECTTPELVGFSIMYLDQLPFALAEAKFLNGQQRNCRIFLGGAAMSALNPVELLQAAPYVEAILTGEGEEQITRLLRGEDWAGLSGCHYRGSRGEILSGGVGNSAQTHPILMPTPNFQGLDWHAAFNPVPVLPIYGCRGCKWRRCRFCTHNSSFGRYRERSPLTVAQEMLDRNRTIGCRYFYIVDQYVDPVYLEALCDAILALEVDCRFEIMARTIAEYTPALLDKAFRAGCRWISWGMESGSQRLLDIMNKGTQVDVAEKVIRNASSAGISNLLMMIFGAPGANRESMEETFSFLERNWNRIDGMTASAFVLFDQTAFARHPEQYGLEVIGSHRFLTVEGRDLYDLKLPFRRTGEHGRMESPLAAQEIAEWEKRRIWLPEHPFYSRMCCEHYLIYADAARSGSNSPGLRSA